MSHIKVKIFPVLLLFSHKYAQLYYAKVLL